MMIGRFWTFQQWLLKFPSCWRAHSRLDNFLTNNLANSLQWTGKRGYEKFHTLSSTDDEKRNRQLNNKIVVSQHTIFACLYHAYKAMSYGNWDMVFWDKGKNWLSCEKSFLFLTKGFFIKGSKRTNWIAMNWSSVKNK